MPQLPEKWIVLPDTQLPYVDLQTLAAVEAFMKDVQASKQPFTGWLQLGDFLDFNEISRFAEGEEDSIEDDIQDSFAAGRAFLARHRAIMGPKAEMVLLEGNHDYRAEAFLLKNGNRRWRKTLDYRRQLQLDDLGVKWVKTWSEGKLFQKGNAYFTHGLYTNQYHAMKMVQRFGCSIYYGHLHDVMEIPLVQRGPDKTLVGKSLGCLCDYNQKYTRGSPTNWQQAFAVFYFFPDGYYTEHTMRIFKHRFVGLNDRVYDGREIVGA